MSTTSRKAAGEETRKEALGRFTLLAHLLDQAFRIPGTPWRFGLDAILGLIPGAGDVFTAIVGAYGIVVARQLGAPASVQGRMLLNLAIDAVVGAIPLFGDMFDFAFKSHVRNRVLLEQWLGRPTAVRRSSILTLLAVLLGLLLIVITTVWLAIAGMRWLYLSLQGAAG